ncbi:hypothetical protein FHS95_000357 [Sphingomonas naasensis]|uniref:Uncharacterized protein n=1 Tax=Sphingomonas naasensis TaxID=1344951 RepID=A0A4S1WWI2_9SPHN|nr:hypothetical protein [Sphingomonas naasensis]NIJ18688.1 hypothetical protein [Sphingomonas naasensis]TGX45926.1 hypothetical protein E5A74_01765 [Sphingomonas naasensis]
MFDAAALAGGAGLDPAAMMQEFAAGDPRMAALMEMMQAQRVPPSNDVEAPDERDDLIAELSARLDAAEARLTKMTRIARQLHEAGRAGSQRLSRLAAALGACGLCWGEDPACLGCRGRGRPGMVRPDPQVRAELFGSQPPLREAAMHAH